MGARILRDYVATYRTAITSTTYDELAEMQRAPYADLAHGGAGTAYALWRLGETRRARTWARAALGDRRHTAYDHDIVDDARRPALLFGRPGIHWVRALVEPGHGDTYARALRGIELDEFVCGAAGHVAALHHLEARPALARARARLGARLLARVRTRVATPWHAGDATLFAHGWPGILYAALAVAPTDAWLLDAVVRLAGAWTGIAPEGFAASWCNGAAGSLLLWTRAFTLTGAGSLIDVARRTAELALATRSGNHGLCCGDVGIAFALLALDRVAPGRWRAAAEALASEAIAAPAFVYPNGLFHGHPGLVCLALDLLGEAPRGFPTLEG